MSRVVLAWLCGRRSEGAAAGLAGSSRRSGRSASTGWEMTGLAEESRLGNQGWMAGRIDDLIGSEGLFRLNATRHYTLLPCWKEPW